MGETLHRRYLNTPTSAVTLLGIVDPSFEENPLTTIHKIIDIYHEKVRDNNDKLHDAFRTLLCYQYQLQFDKKIEAISDYSNKNLLENIRKSLFSFDDITESNREILSDVMILQITLYLDLTDLRKLSEETLESMKKQIDEGKNFHNYFPIIETLLDSLILGNKLNSTDEKEDISIILGYAIEYCFKIIDENNSQEWKPFLSIILKLIKVTDSPDSLFDTLWRLLRDYKTQHTEKKSLKLLCGIIDDLLLKSEVLSVNINSCLDERILLLISDYLTSKIQLHRKQAQYVLKRIVEYLKKHLHKIAKEEMNGELKPPFVFCDDDAFDIEEIKRNYFLLLETLEEKQAHLVLPALSYLDNLVKSSITQESCFNKIWLKCVFTRLLNHDNNTVIKSGLAALFRMDLQLFEDGFISLLIQTLNNTFLYEDQSSDPHPRVLKELSELFIRAEKSEINLTSKFIIAASKINWSPIPLFFVFEALGNNKEMTAVEHNVWGGEESEALRVITEKYVRLQIKIMRLPTQENILKCITIYVKPPLDFLLLGRIFTSIVSDKVLKRGNNNWELLMNYLKKNIEESNAVKSVSECCERLLRDETDGRDIKAVAILIVLICDTGNMLFKASITLNSLCQLFTPITDAYKRPYADQSQLLKALQMITCLMDLSPQAEDNYIMLIFGFSQSIFDFIMSSLRSNWPRTYEVASIHIEALSAILNIQSVSLNFARSINDMINIGDEEIGKIIELISHESTPVIRSWYALNIIYLCDRGCDSIFNGNLPKFVSNERNGKIVSECYGLVAKIYLDSAEQPGKFTGAFLIEKLMLLAEKKSDHAIAGISATLREIIMKLKDDEEMINDLSENIKDIIEVCWKNLWDMNKTTEFWISAGELIRLILDENFLRVDEFRQVALNYVDYIISKTDNNSALRYILFTQMNALRVMEISFIFHDSILSSFLQVNVGKNNERIEIQMCCYIMKQHQIDYLDENLKSGLGVHANVLTRAVLVTLIYRISYQCNDKLAEAWFPQLISMLEKLKNKRYFGNSNVHRLKLRILQVISIFLICVPKFHEKIHDFLTELILTESDQPSVRIMEEWILVFMYCQRNSKKDLIWNSFPLARENRQRSLISLLSIVYHVAKSDCFFPNDKFEYIEKAVANILPSCFSQQFIVRLYSQVILSKLFEMIDEKWPEQSDKYKSIKEAVQESLRYGNLMTNSIKLFDNFYFSVFDPFKHLNLQTIFHELPRLTNVPMDEWIRPEIFKPFIVSRFIYNQDKSLSAIEMPEVLKEFDETPDSDLFQNEDVLADIQKKIIPDSSGLSNIEESVSSPMALRQKLITNDTGLIVIASLIEGYPNLGGLARTAEIFCARELVLKSKRYIENKDFQSLSVTAEKWITISELKLHELRDYLLEKKSMGWNLVSAEQTVNSVNLLDMKFNEKTILLLGNEKNGIPANLIQLMDTCVEIPQAGVVRSLNVHVTGAICMWQYAQQHLF